MLSKIHTFYQTRGSMGEIIVAIQWNMLSDEQVRDMLQAHGKYQGAEKRSKSTSA